jgi:PAS domain-containing protein
MPRVDKNLLIGFSILWVCLTGAFSINFFLTNKVTDSDKVKISNINYILELHKYASKISKINTELQLGSAAPQSLTQLQKTKREILTGLYILKKDNGTHTIEKPLEKLEIETDKILQLWDESYALGTNNSVNQTKLIKQNNSIRILVDEIENHKLIENKKLNIQSSENLRKNHDNSLIILGIFTLISALGLISIFLYRRLVHDKDMSRQEVRDSMDLLKGVFESSQSGIMVFKAIRNNDTSIIDLEWLAVNKKACDLIRRDEKQLIGQRLLKVSPVHATNGLFDAYAKVIQTEVPIELEHEYQLSTGEVLWLYISVSPIADGVAITFTNVTASKHNALKIKESEANLQALINNTADEVWSVDRKYETISANDSFLKRNKPIETTEKWMRILDRALEGESFEQEILLPNNDGETRLINYHFRPVVNNLKEITGVAVFGQDITEKKSTEARIRYQGKILKTILRNIPMILYTIDKDGTLTAIEGKALTMYGMRPEDVVGLNMLDLYPNHTHEIHTALSGKPTHFLWMGPNDPPERFFDTYLFPDENLKGTITGVSLDITQLKISQLALEVAKRRAEEVSAFKTRFLANMSHEIRTPLSAILGFADILRKEDADNRHQEFLGHIENAGTTLFKLIGDILDLTKI